MSLLVREWTMLSVVSSTAHGSREVAFLLCLSFNSVKRHWKRIVEIGEQSPNEAGVGFFFFLVQKIG